MTTSVFLETGFGRPTGSSTLPLREWLGRHWAILFSHPDDFDREQLERDRWIRVMERSFSEHRVRPLELAKPGDDGHAATPCWLDELGEGCSARLSTPIPPPDARHDLRASALRAQILQSGARFAMIIDPELRCRRTVSYRGAAAPPSPLELLGWAVALRERHRCGPEANARLSRDREIRSRDQPSH